MKEQPQKEGILHRILVYVPLGSLIVSAITCGLTATMVYIALVS